jgi:hypothetical protein
MKERMILFWALVMLCLSGQAQEQLHTYRFTPKSTHSSLGLAKKSVGLPFFDDFSWNHIIPFDSNDPDPQLWDNKGAWLNTSMPILPPSFGVITLDGLTVGGEPYSWANNSSGTADTIYSKEIDLSVQLPGDSIYFSFFYEPQGNGDYPDVGDSLVLEFYNSNGDWVNVWAHDGYNTAPSNASTFTGVLVPIYNLDFLHPAFKFRFRNYATYGNNDHWNIDYVKIAANRSYTDIFISDEAFTKAPSNFLKHYTVMPWEQFMSNPSAESNVIMTMPIYNNWNTTRNTSYGMKQYEWPSQTLLHSFQGPSIAVNPLSLAAPTPFDSCNLKWPANALQNYPVNNSCERFLANKFYFNSGAPEYNNNDTVISLQKFAPYFAYDDGSAEWAYALTGNFARLAYAFTLNQADTLTAIQMHWAHIITDNSKLLFNLKVWQSLDLANAVNDVELHTMKFCKPVYVDALYDSINGITTYKIDTPFVVPAGTFYIGWEQLQADPLNIGFDVNNDSHTNLWYDAGLGWTQSAINGAVMMRPYFGSDCLPAVSTGINSITTSSELNVFPNPGNVLTLKNGADVQQYICVYNLQGSLLANTTVSAGTAVTIATESWPNACYLVRAQGTDGKVQTIKWIKSN